MHRKIVFALVVILGVALGCGGEDEPGSSTDPLLDFLLDGGTVNPGRDVDAPGRDIGPRDVTTPSVDASADAPVVERLPSGSPCTQDEECIEGLCLQDPDWPQGTCSSVTCSEADPCDEGAACAMIEGAGRCLATCDRPDGCRLGYRCGVRGRDTRVCLPDNLSLGAPDGEPCTSDSDCAGGACFVAPEYPDGYCSTLHCASKNDCALLGEDNVCLADFTADTRCVRGCSSNLDCRDGYYCNVVFGVSGYCEVFVAPVPPPPPLDNPLPLVCGYASAGGRATLPFTIPAGTTSFGISAYAGDGQEYVLGTVRGPGGAEITLERYLFDTRWPIYAQVFGTGRFPGGIPAGDWTITFETVSTDMCMLVVPESEPGTVLDLNVYVLGVGDDTWETLPDNPDWQRVIAHARTLFAGAGITLRDVRYPRIEPEDAAVIIRNDREAGVVAATYGTVPADTQDGALSIDVFLARAFSFGGVLGISPLTGSMGIHGLRWSGFAMTGEYLGAGTLPFSDAGDSEQYLAGVLVHEAGHYLGLPHVNEASNVMLPIAGVSHTRWNAEQIATMLGNPLTKPEPFVPIPDPEGSGEPAP